MILVVVLTSILLIIEEALSLQKFQMYKKLCMIYNTLKQSILIITTTKAWFTTKISTKQISDQNLMNYTLIALKTPLHIILQLFKHNVQPFIKTHTTTFIQQK